MPAAGGAIQSSFSHASGSKTHFRQHLTRHEVSAEPVYSAKIPQDLSMRGCDHESRYSFHHASDPTSHNRQLLSCYEVNAGSAFTPKTLQYFNVQGQIHGSRQFLTSPRVYQFTIVNIPLARKRMPNTLFHLRLFKISILGTGIARVVHFY